MKQKTNNSFMKIFFLNFLSSWAFAHIHLLYFELALQFKFQESYYGSFIQDLSIMDCSSFCSFLGWGFLLFTYYLEMSISKSRQYCPHPCQLILHLVWKVIVQCQFGFCYHAKVDHAFEPCSWQFIGQLNVLMCPLLIQTISFLRLVNQYFVCYLQQKIDWIFTLLNQAIIWNWHKYIVEEVNPLIAD